MHPISVSDIGEFVQHKSCQRRFRLDHQNGALFQSSGLAMASDVDPVLQASGRRREEEWELSLRRAGVIEVAEPFPGENGVEWMDFVQQLDLLDPNDAGFAREVAVEGNVGAFQIRGRIDFVVAGISDGQPYLRLVECKASRRDKTYHRVQAVLYRILVRQLIHQMPTFVGGLPVAPEHVSCCVVRVDEETHAIQSILDVVPFASADAIEADVRRLLQAEGLFDNILKAPIDDLPFQLEARCDACKYAPHCFTTTAKRRGLELVGLPPTTVRTLQRAGIADIDALADLAMDSEEAAHVRSHPDFVGDLEALHVRARARRTTLNGPETPSVAWIPNTGFGQLPGHDVVDLGAHPRLIRVFLGVTYDYIENRIVGVGAHVTDSPRSLEMADHGPVEFDDDNQASALRGVDVVEFKRAAWTGDYAMDNGAELELLQSVFRQIVDAIELLSHDSEMAAVHFYVWSRYELTQLLEAAGRAGTGMLGSLRELFGCRDKLEQLIYSALQFDVMTRYATAWTSAGLVPTLSLPWNGRTFHWRREIGGRPVDLSQTFHADVFDFVQNIDGQSVEIRAHFADNLPAPYWHAYWGTLPDGADAKPYEAARQPYVLQEYLRARVHAIRWLEESIPHKNTAIVKRPLVVRDLPRFRLATANAAEAAIDFLRFDQHIAYTDWVREHMVPPWVRVASGVSVPVRNLRVVDKWGSSLEGELDPGTYGLSLERLRARSGMDEGAFVRLNEVKDPHQGLSMQSLSFGRTCRVSKIDWHTGKVSLGIIRSNEDDTYMPRSWNFTDRYPPFKNATLDSSVADFVSRRVEERLINGPAKRLHAQGAHVIEWFDPTRPTIPSAPHQATDAIRELLHGRMSDKRIAVVERGLNARIQLVQGPPGTGKTTLTSSALLARVLTLKAPGIVVVSANTHTAVDTLMERTHQTLVHWPQMSQSLTQKGRRLRFFKVGGDGETPGIETLSTRKQDVDGLRDQLNLLVRDGVVPIVGGTTGGILKFAATVGAGLDGSRGTGFQASLLIVDEASMMPFAHFLALASHVHPDGQIMLAGDHRQLSPIVAHDWEREDRPPAVLYHPHVSAFTAIEALGAQIASQPRSEQKVVRDGLEVTYRLPREIRELIQPIYLQDGITLQAPDDAAELPVKRAQSLSETWKSGSLFLLLHDESNSKNANRFEVAIVEILLGSATDLPRQSIAVMTPHRAQRAALKDALAEFSDKIAMIDTVERLQGGECQTIVFSATVSDPVAITQNESFILDLNRSNVAFSRTKERLFVVCSQALLDHMPESVEAYEAAILWKLLRQRCTKLVTRFEVDGRVVQVLTP
ncbi:MAG: AAA domain-containing protein [bacterium]